MKYLLVAAGLFTTSFIAPHKDEYDIKEAYTGKKPAEGTVVLTHDNDLKRADLLLVPKEMDDDHYAVKLTRKADDLYQIDGEDIYIQTESCWESAWSRGATLIIKGSFGHTSGRVIFK